MTTIAALQLMDPHTMPSLLGQMESEPSAADGAVFFGVVAIMGVIGLVLYFVPAVIAMTRRHPNAPAIVILNLLAGWTFIGWVGSLVWSLTTPQAPNTTVYVQSGTGAGAGYGATLPPSQHPAGWYSDPHGSDGERWWDGQTWTEQVRPLPGPAGPTDQ